MAAQSERLCPQCGLELPPTGPCAHCLLRLAFGDETEEARERAPQRPPTGLHSRFFGDYELLDEVARGGMGVVYRARQLSLKRVVALKMVHATHLGSPEARVRFAMEVATAAQLNHPHIVSLYESGEIRGTHFFTMRLVEGGDLAQHIKARRTGAAGPLCAAPSLQSSASIVAMMIKSARALHYAHQRGILHRDIKPSNILIDPQGEPHLADFGLAKMLARESANTYTDSILGSPNYMAPEQAAGLNSELTVATDVYGVGAVLYEALAGVPPFQAGTPVDTIRKVLDEDPIPPHKLTSGIDRDLETICLKCLEKRPAARYGTAEQLAEDLERWQRGEPIRARPVSALGTAWRWSRRHPAVAVLSVALVVALIGMAFVAGLAAVRIRDAEQQAVANLREALLGQARALTYSQEPGMRTEALKLIAQAARLGGSPAFRQRARDDALAALALTDLTFAPQLRLASNDAARQATLDPAMERWAIVQDPTNLVLQRVTDGQVLATVAVGWPMTRVESFSADGRFVALRHADGLSFLDTRAGHWGFATNDGRRAYCFSATGNQLLLQEDDFKISIRELPSFREVVSIETSGGPRGARRTALILSWSPDRELIASTRGNGSVLEMIEAGSGRLRWRVTNAVPFTALAWSLETQRLVVGDGDGRIRSRRLADGGSEGNYDAAVGVRTFAVYADSSLAAAMGDDGLIRFFDLRSWKRLSFVKFDAHNLFFDAEGKRLGPVRRGPEVGWLDLSHSAEFREFAAAPFNYDVQRTQFNRDGEIIAGGYPGAIDLRRASNGVAWRRLPVGLTAVFAFDPLEDAIVTSDTTTGIRRMRLPDVDSGRTELAATERVPAGIPGKRWRALAFSADGRRFAAADATTGLTFVFDRSLTNVLGMMGPQADVTEVALSPDGRWLATAAGRSAQVRVWEVATGKLLSKIETGRRVKMEFSGDGRWLLIHGDTFALRATETWTAAPPLPFGTDYVERGAATFSADGRMLAVVVDDFEIQLLDLKAWNSIGLLRPPSLRHCRSLAFTRDGTRLAAGCSRGAMRIWALDKIRARLAEIGLDWDL